MRELEYPFDSEYLLRKSRSLRRALVGDGSVRLKKRIAVLGGSTTHDVIRMLELFLLDAGIEPEFYESQYNRYYEDGVFGNEELSSFRPEIVYIHTTGRNVPESLFPTMEDTPDQVEEKLDQVYRHFQEIWEGIRRQLGCLMIQNNFEKPPYRRLGNMDAWDHRGREHFLAQLNLRFGAYAREHEDLLIQDLDWLAACCGLDRFHDPFYWHMYKYSPAPAVIPELAHNLAGMIRAVCGKGKKALALDLDNTLWGGVVGDDGAENLEIGQETGLGQIYQEFQGYLKACKERGILLTVDSKNEESNARAGLGRPDSILRPEDFVAFKANWEPKDENLKAIARELDIGVDSLIFVDDNPAERHRVSAQLPQVSVPEMTIGTEPQPERYIRMLDRCGLLEPVGLSREDLTRSSMYQANVRRRQSEGSFADYGEYLASLQMRAWIGSFPPQYMQRIAQLTNKSNQFNLTTRRCTQAELEAFAADGQYLTLCGRLEDRFGDNGVVSVVLGRQEGTLLHLELWLMSCRVLKRDMEKAMLDKAVAEAGKRGITRLRGYYYPTAKNAMVREFYGDMGFIPVAGEPDLPEGASVWELETEGYRPMNRYIEVL